jgi:hypothetical protein
MATCEPTLFLFAAKEILLAHFIIKNFQNVVYTLAAKFFDDVGIVLPRPKRPRRQFSSGYVKVRFHSLDVLWRTKHFCRHFLSLNVKLVTAKIKFFWPPYYSGQKISSTHFLLFHKNWVWFNIYCHYD